jgi:hypothetical protein
VDIAPLEELSDTIVAAAAYLFKPKVAWRLNQTPDDQMGGGAEKGQMQFSTNSPPQGAEFVYRVGPNPPSGRAQIAILDPAGDTVQTLSGSGSAGVHASTGTSRCGARPVPHSRPPAGATVWSSRLGSIGPSIRWWPRVASSVPRSTRPRRRS